MGRSRWHRADRPAASPQPQVIPAEAARARGPSRDTDRSRQLVELGRPWALVNQRPRPCLDGAKMTAHALPWPAASSHMSNADRRTGFALIDLPRLLTEVRDGGGLTH